MTKKKSKKRGNGAPSSTSSTKPESVEEEVLDTSVDLNASVDLDTSVDLTTATEDIPPSSQQIEESQVVEEVSEGIVSVKEEEVGVPNDAEVLITVDEDKASEAVKVEEDSQDSNIEHIEVDHMIEQEETANALQEEEAVVVDSAKEIDDVEPQAEEEVVGTGENPVSSDHKEGLCSNPPLQEEEQIVNNIVETASSEGSKEDISHPETSIAIEEVTLEEQEVEEVEVDSDHVKEEEVLPQTESAAPVTDESVAVLTSDVALKLALSSEETPAVAEEGWNEFNASYVTEDTPEETRTVEDDGWRFYTSVEGYPYYYNEFSGQSIWAQLDENGQAKSLAESIRYAEQQNKQQLAEAEEEDEEGEEDDDDEEEEEEESEEEEDEDGDDEEDDEEDDEDLGVPNDLKFDEELEAKFRAYLRTPEGIAAVLEEQERIRKYAERKAEKEQRKQQRDYARKVHLTKKTDGADPATDKSIFSTLLDGFKWLAGNEETKSKITQKSSPDSPNRPTKVKFDDYGRETKHRNKSGATPADGMAVNKEWKSLAEVENGEVGGQKVLSSAGSSLASSSGSSEVDSVSSDDSDVEIINAPLVPTSVLPAWLQVENLYGNLIQPTQQIFETSGIIASTHTLGDYLVRVASEWAGRLTVTSLTVGEQALQSAGTMAYQATITTGHVLYPYLVHFMETVIDNNGSNSSSNTASINNKKKKRIKTSKSENDEKTAEENPETAKGDASTDTATTSSNVVLDEENATGNKTTVDLEKAQQERLVEQLETAL